MARASMINPNEIPTIEVMRPATAAPFPPQFFLESPMLEHTIPTTPGIILKTISQDITQVRIPNTRPTTATTLLFGRSKGVMTTAC